MSFSFRPARSYTERKGCFVALNGTTNSGKTFSALRLARGLAGPKGKIAVLDTEGGRTLHLKEFFEFDAAIMDPPFRPALFAEAATQAEVGGYDVLLIDSFTMEWRGIGGVLDWEEAELKRIAGDDFKKRERVKQMARIPGRMAHKSMVFSFLQRRIPIIFSIRGEETIKQEEGQKPEKVYKAQCSPSFPFEMTVAFRLASDRKGCIDLSDPHSWKMEEAHRAIFRDGDRLSEDHGAALAAWATGDAPSTPVAPRTDKSALAARGIIERIEAAETAAAMLAITDDELVRKQRDFLREKRPELATEVEAAVAAAYQRLTKPADDEPETEDATESVPA
jgi:hypothetical protein